MSTGGFPPGVKRSTRSAGLSPPSSAEVKNGRSSSRTRLSRDDVTHVSICSFDSASLGSACRPSGKGWLKRR
jgi:hypothetical protein